MMLFLITLIAILIGAFYLYHQITSLKISPLNLKINSSQSEVENKFKNLNQSGDVEVSLSEDELNAILSGGLSFQSFVLKDTQTSIAANQIILYGDLIKPLSSKVAIGLLPEVVDGKINFKIKDVVTGNLNLPSFLNKKIEKSFNDSVDAKLSFIYNNISINTVELKDSTMVIKGRSK